MSDENSMANEIIALKKKLDNVEEENAELKEQNAKLLEKIEAMEAEKRNNLPTNQGASNPNKSIDLEEKMDEKNEKITGRSVPNWLIEVLAWIKRVEMADSKLSTSNWTFKQLCWPKLHGNVKPYNVGWLDLYDELNESMGIYEAKLTRKREQYGIGVNIPIACIKPPKYIIGFEYIGIVYLDDRILQFIECIISNLNGIAFLFNPDKFSFWYFWYNIEKFGQVHRLYEILAKKAIFIFDENFMDFLRFHPNAFGIIENAQKICAKIHKYDIDLLLKWLTNSRADNKPKFTDFNLTKEIGSILIDRIKEQFIGSTQPANFLMPLFFFHYKPQDYPIFSLENDQTGEVLAIYEKANAPYHPLQFLVRHSKGEEYLRDIWEKEEREPTSSTCIEIFFPGNEEF